MQYYSNSAISQNSSFVPLDSDRCQTSPKAILSQTPKWEGTQKSCTFPTGVTFTEGIDQDANTRADFSYAGFV